MSKLIFCKLRGRMLRSRELPGTGLLEEHKGTASGWSVGPRHEDRKYCCCLYGMFRGPRTRPSILPCLSFFFLLLDETARAWPGDTRWKSTTQRERWMKNPRIDARWCWWKAGAEGVGGVQGRTHPVTMAFVRKAGEPVRVHEPPARWSWNVKGSDWKDNLPDFTLEVASLSDAKIYGTASLHGQRRQNKQHQRGRVEIWNFEASKFRPPGIGRKNHVLHQTVVFLGWLFFSGPVFVPGGHRWFLCQYELLMGNKTFFLPFTGQQI